MNIWDEVDAREKARKKAAVEYRESLKRQQDDVQRVKHEEHSRMVAQPAPSSKDHMTNDFHSPPWMNELAPKLPLPPIPSSQMILSQVEIPKNRPPLSISLSSRDEGVNLTLLKDQLLSEKEKSSKLESELRKQQSLISTIMSQLEQQRFAISEASNSRFLSQKYEQQLSSLLEEQSSAKMRADTLESTLKQLMQEIKTRSSFGDQEHKESIDHHRAILEEIQQIKFKYDQLSMESVQADKELFLRTRELETSVVQETAVKQTIRQHDTKIVSIERELYSLKETIDGRYSRIVQEFRNNSETSDKKQSYFEQNILKQLGDLKAIFEVFSRDTGSKLSTVREKVVSTVGAELEALSSQLRDVVSYVKKVEFDSNTRFSTLDQNQDEKLNLIHSALKEEISLRKHSEKSFRNEHDMIVKSLHLELQNIRDGYSENLAKAKNEFLNMMQKTVTEKDRSNEDLIERLRAVEERALLDSKKHFETAQTIKTWVETCLNNHGLDVQTSVESKFAVLEQSLIHSIKRMESQQKSEIESTLTNMKEIEIRPLLKDVENLRSIYQGTDRFVSSRNDEFASKVSEMRSQLDVIQTRLIPETRINQLMEQIHVLKNDFEKYGLNIRELDAVSKNISEKVDMDSKEVNKIRRELDSKATTVYVNDEVSRLNNTIKGIENGLKRTWKLMDGQVNATSPGTYNNQIFTSEILNDLQQLNEKIASLQRSNSNQEKQHDAMYEQVEVVIFPKLLELETGLHSLKHLVDDDLSQKYHDFDKEFSSFRTLMTKNLMQHKETHVSDVEKLSKQLSIIEREVENQVESTKQHLLQIENHMRVNQEKQSHMQISALEDQLTKLARWKEDVHRKLEMIQEYLDVLSVEPSSPKMHTRFGTDIENYDFIDQDAENNNDIHRYGYRPQNPNSYPNIEKDNDIEDGYIDGISKVLEDADRLLAQQDMTMLQEEEESPDDEFEYNDCDQKKVLDETRKSILKNLNKSVSRSLRSISDENYQREIEQSTLNEDQLATGNIDKSDNRLKSFSNTNLDSKQDEYTQSIAKPISQENLRRKTITPINHIPSKHVTSLGDIRPPEKLDNKKIFSEANISNVTSSSFNPKIELPHRQRVSESRIKENPVSSRDSIHEKNSESSVKAAIASKASSINIPKEKEVKALNNTKQISSLRDIRQPEKLDNKKIFSEANVSNIVSSSFNPRLEVAQRITEKQVNSRKDIANPSKSNSAASLRTPMEKLSSSVSSTSQIQDKEVNTYPANSFSNAYRTVSNQNMSNSQRMNGGSSMMSSQPKLTSSEHNLVSKSSKQSLKSIHESSKRLITGMNEEETAQSTQFENQGEIEFTENSEQPIFSAVTSTDQQ